MKTMNLFLGMILLGALLWSSAAEQAGAQPGMGGRGRGWGAQMRRAQMAQQAEQTSSSAKAKPSTSLPGGCAGCCMGGGCCMMGSSAATTQSLQQNSKANQMTSATQAMSMRRGRGMGMGRGMMGMGGPREDMREAMPVIHDLLAQHDKVKRKVENIPQGIVTETTSVDLEVAAQIRKHVGQMKKRLEQGQPMRMWDPLFQEIFRNAGKIQMKIEEIPGGVRVTETSADPRVQLLIRQHAQAVVQFVEKGMPAAHEAHSLPKGYLPE